LTRIPLSASSTANARVRPSTPAFEAEYCAVFSMPRLAHSEELKTMLGLDPRSR